MRIHHQSTWVLKSLGMVCIAIGAVSWLSGVALLAAHSRVAATAIIFGAALLVVGIASLHFAAERRFRLDYYGEIWGPRPPPSARQAARRTRPGQ
jgi:NO-binding membrane sensor protein with MHYT domain